jgi:AraC-like DNA-binding protein
MIRYGPMSIVLLCAALYGVLRAGTLCCIPANRRANRLLAALIVILSLYTAPYIIGYAGYYDAYPWLSFAPYNLTLAIGPLLYLYLIALQSGDTALPQRWRLHFLPALLQLAYYCVIFFQPIGFKNDWNGSVHERLIDPLETAGLVVSLAVYWRLAHCALKEKPTAPAEWGRNFLMAMGLSILIWYGMLAAEWAFSGLSYFQRFPFYMWLAMLVCHLGSGAYRSGSYASGAVTLPLATPGAAQAADPESRSKPDQATLGQRWRDAIVDAQWWRDPDLNLTGLAQQLGTNTTALSRAFNEGLGMNFNEVLNRIRVDAVLAALKSNDGGRSVLDIALAEGFSSKASFNRVFKQYTGETPSDYRRRLQSGGLPLQVSTS